MRTVTIGMSAKSMLASSVRTGGEVGGLSGVEPCGADVVGRTISAGLPVAGIVGGGEAPDAAAAEDEDADAFGGGLVGGVGFATTGGFGEGDPLPEN